MNKYIAGCYFVSLLFFFFNFREKSLNTKKNAYKYIFGINFCIYTYRYFNLYENKKEYRREIIIIISILVTKNKLIFISVSVCTDNLTIYIWSIPI